MQRLQALPQYLSEEPCEEPNSSTDTLLIDWLNRMATDPKSYLGYCILNHKKDGAEKVHKHPKGRPSKKNPRMPIPEVVQNMTYRPNIPESDWQTSESEAS